MGARRIFTGVGKLTGLEDKSFPAGFRGGTPVCLGVKPPEADDMN